MKKDELLNFEIFPWNKNFETDIQSIDAQHKKLVDLLNKLAAHLTIGSDDIVLNDIFNELADYADYHFKSEEEIWKKYLKDDEWTKEHVNTHISFIDQVIEIKNNKDNKPIDDVVYDIIAFLAEWLAYHILDSDKRLAIAARKIMSGAEIEDAKRYASNEMNGSLKNIVNSVLSMYSVLSTRTLDLMREHRLREKAEQELIKSKTVAEQSAQSKSDFLANMSHEIRTPLNAIMGFIYLLKEESRGRKAKKYVDIISDSSKSLLNVIEDILDFSKIESGKLDIDKIDFNSRAEFEVMTHLFDAQCSNKNISLSLKLDNNIPQILNTDPLRVKQVITNLLSNAVKFTPEGKSITIEIKYTPNMLNVSVKDEGIGISKEKQEHIFSAFGQEDVSTTRKFGGTGLGLSISKELVKLLGGELKLKSVVDVGSEFYFSIPVTIGKNTDQTLSDEHIEVDFKDKKILLVEDNKANQMYMQVLFKKSDILFEIANDGVEAVEKFKKSKYDVVLMDENMPNMNGLEATKQILEYEKQNSLQHTPIIALTANALKGDRERFIEAGLDEYLTKPIDMKKLFSVLQKIT